ncbi:MAG: hypothetical protein IJX19_00595 [Clostridia bacterium]|nr:hypothetical protein [Clostridia bacterium]
MSRSSMRIKYITVSAMLCALGVILMSVGSLIEVLDLSTAVLASMLCVYAIIEIGKGYPWMIWLVTSILSLILLPIKTPAIFYALFAGFYPILKEKLEKLSRPISWLLKLVVFHLCLGLIFLILKLFLPSALEGTDVWWMLAAIYGMALVCFVVYDIALTRLITFYLFRLRKHFRIK